MAFSGKRERPKAPAKSSGRGGGKPTLVYGLFGPDPYQREEFLKRLRKEVLPTGDTLNFEIYSALQGGLADALNAARTLPFGAARKIVLVRDLDKRARKKAEGVDKVEGEDEDKGGLPPEEIAGLEKYLSRPSSSTILVLEGAQAPPARLKKLLEEAGELIKAEPLKESQVPGWLMDRAREAGRGLSREAAQVIAERVGTDLALASQELEKVFLYTDAPTLGADAVWKTLAGGSSVGAWDLSNAVGARDLAGSVRSLNRLFAAGEPPILIVGQLARQIRKLLRTRVLLDEGRTETEIGKRLKIANPYALRCTCRDARSYTQAEMRRGLSELSRVDLKLKSASSSVHPHLRLEIFLVGFVAGRTTGGGNPSPSLNKPEKSV